MTAPDHGHDRPRPHRRDRRTRGGRVSRAHAQEAALHARAKQSLPLGVASSFQSYDPYPLFMGDARGSRIWDVDGNEYVDFDMAFGVLAAGHSHPVFADVLAHRVANGTCYTFPVEDSIILAEEIKRRFGCDLVRFSNSGTEATMDAIRVARGFTGREKIVKFEGGYHGHHDDVLVSIQPPREFIGPVDAPNDRARVRRSAALSRRGDGRRAVQQPGGTGRDPRAPRGARSRRSSSSRSSSTSASCRHSPASWSASASWPRQHGCVLIFDEVKTGVVLAYGGATEWFGVKPDLFCLAKSIGGGVPIGAFGGRGEVMGVIEKLPESRRAATPARRLRTRPSPAARHASRTWARSTAIPLSMAAGVAVLTQILTRDVYPRAAGHGRPTDRRLPGRWSTSSGCPATRSTSDPRAA